MKTNLNTEPTKQSAPDEIKRAEQARLEALRIFYLKMKRLADDRSRNR